MTEVQRDISGDRWAIRRQAYEADVAQRAGSQALWLASKEHADKPWWLDTFDPAPGFHITRVRGFTYSDRSSSLLSPETCDRVPDLRVVVGGMMRRGGFDVPNVLFINVLDPGAEIPDHKDRRSIPSVTTSLLEMARLTIRGPGEAEPTIETLNPGDELTVFNHFNEAMRPGHNLKNPSIDALRVSVSL